jgi:hypothetical protein
MGRDVAARLRGSVTLLCPPPPLPMTAVTTLATAAMIPTFMELPMYMQSNLDRVCSY